VKTSRNTRTRFLCDKPGHFIADCPGKMENKDNYKHQSRTESKCQSRRDHKHKHKNKDERRSRKKYGHGKKARAIVRARDVDSNFSYSTLSSSSSEDERDRRKGKIGSKNLSRLSCFSETASAAWHTAPTARRARRTTWAPTLRMWYVKSFPSCARRMRN
jgi:hypothetical protein